MHFDANHCDRIHIQGTEIIGRDETIVCTVAVIPAGGSCAVFVHMHTGVFVHIYYL